MTILLTGFSSFPGAPVNPTEIMVRSIGTGWTSQGERIVTAVLPVEWEGSWNALKDAIALDAPRAVLMFGLHARAERLRIELTARNARELGRQDAAGGYPSGPAIGDGPERIAVRLPLSFMTTALHREGFDFELSQDAGRYLCNDSLYRLCRHGEKHGLDFWGFVHTPLTDEVLDDWHRDDALPELCHTMPGDKLREAALCLVRVLAGRSG